MLLPKTQEILADLVINQALADVSPRLGRRRVMNYEEDHDEYPYASGSIDSVDKEHADAADERSHCCARPIEVVE